MNCQRIPAIWCENCAKDCKGKICRPLDRWLWRSVTARHSVVAESAGLRPKGRRPIDYAPHRAPSRLVRTKRRDAHGPDMEAAG